MGTWGPGIYQNDLSDDVRAFYRDQLRRGKTGEEITEILISGYAQEISDVDDCIDFWCALADTQWELGRLTPEVKQRALECIESPNVTLRWKLESDTLCRKRQQVLDKLREKLCQQQPAEKKVKQYKFYHCPWQIGDVFALPLEGDAVDQVGLSGQYLLIEKVAQADWYPGHTIPVVYLKITRNGQLPACIEEYNQLEFVRDLVIPRSMKSLIEDETFIQQNTRKTNAYPLDQNEDFSICQIGLVTTSKRVIPAKLHYVGNFSNTARPRYELVPQYGINLPVELWKRLPAFLNDRIVRHGTVKAMPNDSQT